MAGFCLAGFSPEGKSNRKDYIKACLLSLKMHYSKIKQSGHNKEKQGHWGGGAATIISFMGSKDHQ